MVESILGSWLMKEARREIVNAKIHLYHLILELKFGAMTQNDLNIGTALIQDSEIQAFLEAHKGD